MTLLVCLFCCSCFLFPSRCKDRTYFFFQKLFRTIPGLFDVMDLSCYSGVGLLHVCTLKFQLNLVWYFFVVSLLACGTANIFLGRVLAMRFFVAF